MDFCGKIFCDIFLELLVMNWEFNLPVKLAFGNNRHEQIFDYIFERTEEKRIKMFFVFFYVRSEHGKQK